MSWLVTHYECAGHYCFIGERFCSYFPWHILGLLILTTIIMLSLIKMLPKSQVKYKPIVKV